ncbi:hypothetical protein AYL99_06413 [Fonsecaea erecta]|uniref:Methyltransferase domain-containing protein n=1 Tax=Fonsecaea erecta TaxID=1367422 RepID=A0A178ZJA2_9EURO|nr:hypothetical protein AYL99_06413 [Fonsecaea erecta]OAP59115.1 hypothetical protein AYL99_06413 [Fonsecaea erecta]
MSDEGDPAGNREDEHPLIDADEDEGVGDLDNISTASLRSSFLQPVYSHGRRYQSYRDGEYHRPNDEVSLLCYMTDGISCLKTLQEELRRLDWMDEIFFLINKRKLHLAPVGHGSLRVLDIGFGTGMWAMAMGDKYPQAEIIGVDISASAPEWVPPNTRFEIADIEDEWTFSAPFDYIHCRYMAGAIRDWPQLMRRTFENLKPGAWAEFADLEIDYYSQDGTLTEDDAIPRWIKLATQGMEDLGRTLRPGRRLEGWVRDAGFVNVNVVRSPVPVGPWPKNKDLKQIGLLNVVQLSEGLTGLNVRLFCDFLGWTRPELDILMMEVRNDFKNPAIHSIYDM